MTRGITPRLIAASCNDQPRATPKKAPAFHACIYPSSEDSRESSSMHAPQPRAATRQRRERSMIAAVPARSVPEYVIKLHAVTKTQCNRRFLCQSAQVCRRTNVRKKNKHRRESNLDLDLSKKRDRSLIHLLSTSVPKQSVCSQAVQTPVYFSQLSYFLTHKSKPDTKCQSGKKRPTFIKCPESISTIFATNA